MGQEQVAEGLHVRLSAVKSVINVAAGMSTAPPSMSKAYSKPSKKNRLSLASFETAGSLPGYHAVDASADVALLEGGVQDGLAMATPLTGIRAVTRTEGAIEDDAGLKHRWRRRGLSVATDGAGGGPPSYQSSPSEADPSSAGLSRDIDSPAPPDDDGDEIDIVLDQLLAASSDLLASSRAALSSTRFNRSSLSSLSTTLEGSLDRTIRASERELRRRLDVFEERTVLLKALERELVGWGHTDTGTNVRPTLAEEAREVQGAIVAAERTAGARLAEERGKLERQRGALGLGNPMAGSPTIRLRPGKTHNHVRSSSQSVPRYATMRLSAGAAADSAPNLSPNNFSPRTPSLSLRSASAGSSESEDPASPCNLSSSAPPTAHVVSGSFLGRIFRDPSVSSSSSPSRRPSEGSASPRSPARAADVLQNIAARQVHGARRGSLEQRGRTASAQSSVTITASGSSPLPGWSSKAAGAEAQDTSSSSVTSLHFSTSEDWSSHRSASSSSLANDATSGPDALLSPETSVDDPLDTALCARRALSGKKTGAKGVKEAAPALAPELRNESASAVDAPEGGRKSSAASELLKSLWAGGK